MNYGIGLSILEAVRVALALEEKKISVYIIKKNVMKQIFFMVVAASVIGHLFEQYCLNINLLMWCSDPFSDSLATLDNTQAHLLCFD